MSISIHNYEIYFIDYHEGKLSEDQAEALMDFLAAHPELKEEFEGFDNTPLVPDIDITFNNKASLKKEEQYYSETEQKIIAYLEGDLDTDEHAKIEKLINDDAGAAILLSHYKSTMSEPDMDIEYPDKTSLRKKVPFVVQMNSRLSYAAAAVIILLLGISSIFMFDLTGDAVREEIRIGRLGAQENELLATASLPLLLDNRDAGEVRWRNVERDEIVLDRLPAVELAGTIPVQSYQMSINQEIRYINPYFLDLSEENEALADASESKTAAGRIISGFFGKLQKPFKSDDSGIKESDSKSFSIWDIAEYGVKGINALGDHEYTMVRQYNDKGNVKGIMIVEE